MADSLLYEQSLETQGTNEPFISRQVVQVLDQNGGNYNGQIQIDTSSLSNSGKYASYGEAYLVVPIVTTLQYTGTNTDWATRFNGGSIPFGAGLKCGSHHLIHSLSVSYNNSDVVQLTPFTNFYVQYKLLTQFSQEDVAKEGLSIGFVPDSSDSFNSITAANAILKEGVGVTNNRNFPTTTTLASYDAYQKTLNNKGLLERQRDTAWQAAATAPAAFISSEANWKGLGKNLYNDVATSNAKVWYTLAKIRLKDIHSFFDQLPLVKGAFITLRINTNTVEHKLDYDYTTAASNAVYTGDPLYCTSSVINGGTSPIILASAGTNQGGAPLWATALGAAAAGNPAVPADATYNHSFRVSVGVDSKTSTLSHPTWGAQTRLFVPLYQMSPIDEEKYLSLNRTKRIVYEDIYNYQVNVAAGDGFNQLLTNGIPNPTCVVCIPFVAASANDIGFTGKTNKTAPWQSPFTTEPGTTSPLIAIKDFNVQVAGLNMFTQNETYDFEQFVNELSSKNAINGNLVNGLTSGLINEYMFQNMYRYYVCDISRRLPAEDTVPKSVSVMGKNLSLKDISIFVFVLFRRELTVDLATGQKLD